MTVKRVWNFCGDRRRIRYCGVYASLLAWLLLVFSGLLLLPGIPSARPAASGDLSVNPGNLHLRATLGQEVAAAVSVEGGSAPYVFSVNGVGRVDDLTLSSAGSTYYRYTIATDESPGETRAVIQVVDGEGNTAECPVTIEMHGKLAVIPGSLNLNGVLGSEVAASVSVIGGFAPYSLTVSGAGHLAARTLEKAGNTGYRFAIPGDGHPGVETAAIRVVDAEGNTTDCPVTIEIHEALSVSPDNLTLRGVAGETVGASLSAGGGFSPYELSVAGAGSVTDERLEKAGSTQYRYSIPENASAGEETAVIRVSDAAGHNATCPVAVEIHEALSVNPRRLHLKGMLGGGTVVQISVEGGFPPYELSVAGAGSVTDERLEKAGSTQYGYLIPGNASAGDETAVIRVSDAAGHNVACPVAVEIHEALSVKPVSAGLSGSPGEKVSVSVSVEGGFAPYTLSVNGPGVVEQARLGEKESTAYSYTIPPDSQPGKKRAEIHIRDEQGNIVRCRVSIRIF